ncbi:MAG: glycosyltransferase family 4 protein [Opitutales bacterium]|nr:glycosyltransferase family 4 protein [Opitutales bacterium]MDP4643028.1 glycosyltransferase family 4 protein [Opitutales bacterium]MDP4693102.1 glycosyltransferase family 4 protein [Opitutales bacterium]MDP4777930.1 glycosyltransferase family 4 protein [Opitutales bacterium]MDP4882831.1 glycosyltransferase family 4 protein [Opitutales bacterium]
MKILILTSLYPPLGSSGHHARCQQVVEALSKRGHRLQVLTSNHRLPPMGVATDKGVFRDLTLRANHTDADLRALTYQEVLTLDLGNAAVVDYRVTRFKPDIILVWDAMHLSNSVFMRLQNKRVPVVYDLHNEWLASENYERDPWFWWWRKQKSISVGFRKLWMTWVGARRRILRKLPVHLATNLDLSHAWCASACLRDKLVAEGLTSLTDRPVIYSALNPVDLIRKEHYAKTMRFMWAGRLSETKAPDLALDAVACLVKKGVPVTLDIYGMGEPLERKTFRENIVAMGLSDSVKMVGIRPGQLAGKYLKYDALLFTSRANDPFPVTPVEAMWSGLPCIVSNDGGIREVVADGETAILFESGSVESLVAAMERFISFPDAGERLARQCIEGLQDRHSMDTYLDEVEAIISSAVTPKP